MFNKFENYKAALENIQMIQKAGGWIHFETIKKKYGLSAVTRKNLIPDLTKVDLGDEAVLWRLYEEQENFLKDQRKRSEEKNGGTPWRCMKSKLKALEEENAALRKRCATR